MRMFLTTILCTYVVGILFSVSAKIIGMSTITNVMMSRAFVDGILWPVNAVLYFC